MPKQDTALNFRNVPASLAHKLKVAAAVHQSTLKDYCVDVLQKHIDDLERKGVLPKSK